MISMIIPKGRDYSFTVKVLQRDSFLPQDLTNMSNTSSLRLIESESGSTIITATPQIYDAHNGILECTLVDSDTNSLKTERGDKVDGYYSKPLYKALLEVKFTDDTAPVTTVIDNIATIAVG